MSALTVGSGIALRARLRRAWQGVHLASLVLALALSASIGRAPLRRALAAQLVRASTPLVAWFTALAAVLALVIIRIVLVTAQSYGLSQVALEMVVRVLVIELIPLAAAFTVAMRVALPMAAELARLRRQGVLESAPPGDALRLQIAPRALAAIFCVLLLAAVACAVALVLAYLLAHGFSPWALERYTRMVGQVFSPVVSLVFVLKTGALALAVALVPIAAALHGREREAGELELHGLVPMSLAVLAVEALALMGNYL